MAFSSVVRAQGHSLQVVRVDDCWQFANNKLSRHSRRDCHICQSAHNELLKMLPKQQHQQQPPSSMITIAWRPSDVPWTEAGVSWAEGDKQHRRQTLRQTGRLVSTTEAGRRCFNSYNCARAKAHSKVVCQRWMLTVAAVMCNGDVAIKGSGLFCRDACISGHHDSSSSSSSS